MPKTARPPRSDDPFGGREAKAFAKARYRSLQGVGATSCLRARPTHSLSVIPAAEFVDIGRCFMEVEECMPVRCPCCDAVDEDTRHARICPRAVEQVNQHQPLLHAIFRTLKRLEIPHQVETGEPLTVDGSLRVDVVVRREDLWDSSNREYMDTSVLLDVTQADPQAQVRLRGGCADTR